MASSELRTTASTIRNAIFSYSPTIRSVMFFHASTIPNVVLPILQPFTVPYFPYFNHLHCYFSHSPAIRGAISSVLRPSEASCTPLFEPARDIVSTSSSFSLGGQDHFATSPVHFLSINVTAGKRTVYSGGSAARQIGH